MVSRGRFPFAAGGHAVVRGVGIGHIREVKLTPMPDGEVAVVEVDIVRFTSRSMGGSAVVDKALRYAVPLTQGSGNRIRKPVGMAELSRLLRDMQSGGVSQISRKDLLASGFNADFFDLRTGFRQMVSLHDYLLHNHIDGKPSCREYAELYTHSLGSLAYEGYASDGVPWEDVRDAIEMALFTGHASRGCVPCEHRRPGYAESVEAYVGPARSWLDSLAAAPSGLPEALRGCPAFLSPCPIENARITDKGNPVAIATAAT